MRTDARQWLCWLILASYAVCLVRRLWCKKGPCFLSLFWVGSSWPRDHSAWDKNGGQGLARFPELQHNGWQTGPEPQHAEPLGLVWPSPGATPGHSQILGWKFPLFCAQVPLVLHAEQTGVRVPRSATSLTWLPVCLVLCPGLWGADGAASEPNTGMNQSARVRVPS